MAHLVQWAILIPDKVMILLFMRLSPTVGSTLTVWNVLEILSLFLAPPSTGALSLSLSQTEDKDVGQIGVKLFL